MKQQQKTLIVWLVFAAILLGVWMVVSGASGRRDETKFAELISAIEKGEIAEVKIQDTQKGIVFEGTYKAGGKFQTLGVLDEGVRQALQDAFKQHQTTYTIAPRESGTVLLLLAQFLPMVLIVLVLVFLMRQVQAGGGKAMSFGKSRARLMNESQNKVTFADVAGVDESRIELEEIVHFLKDPKKFTRLGGRIPKGVLLMGPPGTGKTLLAKAIAGEAGVPFFSIAGSDFVEMFVGVGASRVRDLFEQGKKNAPCIIFIDEIDAVGRHRGAGMGGGHDEREQTLNQLLVEMDGFESNEGVIIIAATNRPDVLDPAILRPGRFDRRIVVPRPDVSGREQIFKVHIKKVPAAADVDVEVLARMTPGMSGADIENLVNESALIAARSDKQKVSMGDFEAARDKVLMGNERRSLVMTQRELEATAYHEAGHAIVGVLLGRDGAQAGSTPDFVPLHKVTIIPRGAALGVTSFLPDDRKSMSKTFAENRVAMAMGGRIAEELIFGDLNSGAVNDIEQATDLARAMVTEWGMSEKLGPLAFGGKEGEVFLGRDFAQSPNYSNQTAENIDAEVHRIVTEQYSRAKALVMANLDRLHALARALLEYETLDGKDIEQLMGGGIVARTRPQTRIKTREQIDEDRSKPSAAAGILISPLPEPGR